MTRRSRSFDLLRSWGGKAARRGPTLTFWLPRNGVGLDVTLAAAGDSGGKSLLQVAGMVFVDTGAPFRNPPREIVEDTDPSNPANVERRDYLQVEKDAWAARRQVGDIPVAIVTVEYSDAAVREAPFRSERAGMRRNVEDQKGWLVLSPRAKQSVVHTGHAVEEDDPGLVIDVILDVVKAAQ